MKKVNTGITNDANLQAFLLIRDIPYLQIIGLIIIREWYQYCIFYRLASLTFIIISLIYKGHFTYAYKITAYKFGF
jgi:hypothetical protein